MVDSGIEIYPGRGKKPWDRAKNSYPPRSHDCMPDETEFAETFQDAQEDLERREKNAKKRRTMMMCGRMRSMNNGEPGLLRLLGK